LTEVYKIMTVMERVMTAHRFFQDWKTIKISKWEVSFKPKDGSFHVWSDRSENTLCERILWTTEVTHAGRDRTSTWESMNKVSWYHSYTFKTSA